MTKVKETLASSGVDRATARKVLKIWKETGATNPESLRKMFIQKGFNQSAAIALQLGLDASASFIAFYTGTSIKASQAFGSATLAVEFLAYTVGMYLAISCALDLFSLAAVATATYKYSTEADAFLAAVQEMAGPTEATGLGVVDKAKQAVNIIKVLKALDAVLAFLKSVPEADRNNLLNDLGAYLTLERAERVFGFQPGAFNLTSAEATTIASVFSKYDVNDDGMIDLQEFNRLCLESEETQHLSSEEVESAFGLLDKNGSGSISFVEWVSWWVDGAKQKQIQ
jgi:Ca2+-binding EF-hand superfamily protein